MFLIEELDGEFIVENRLGFLESDSMFADVCLGLGGIPLKTNHTYSVFNMLRLSTQTTYLSMGLTTPRPPLFST